MNIGGLDVIGYSGHDAFEQAKPVTYGDTLYLVAQLENQYPNLYSILALKDSTVVRLNGQVLDTVDRDSRLIPAKRAKPLLRPVSQCSSPWPGPL
ncbi:MAG: hypothetical protein U5L96_15265 [Owenweeksia sp.]|nr:hypothetical protein [Owenweeksia sp.]